MSTETYYQTIKKTKKIIQKFFSYMDLCNQVSKSHVLDHLGQNNDDGLFCNLVREPSEKNGASSRFCVHTNGSHG